MTLHAIRQTRGGRRQAAGAPGQASSAPGARAEVQGRSVKIAYLVQDLADAAVEKRVRTLRQGGAEIDLYGFRRAAGSRDEVGGVTPHELGQAQDAALGRRVLSLLRLGASTDAWAKEWADADLIIARNLDNLLLAAVAKHRLGLRTPLVYELLDIHTVMFKDHPLSRLLRAIEGQLLRAAEAVIISSPAFERDYLARYHRYWPQVLLVENKVFGEVAANAPPTPINDGPPWRIGWFGAVRCRPSLECLARLVKAYPGLFEVHIRGRFVDSLIGDVGDLINNTPGIYYHGPYKAPEDLCRIYGEVHFTWAVDLCQEGANSDWLLPNRLYEGGLHGAVPIALRTVETGRWLQQHGIGLLVDTPLDESVHRLLSDMTPANFCAASTKLRSLNTAAFQWTDAECRDLVKRLSAVGQETRP